MILQPFSVLHVSHRDRQIRGSLSTTFSCIHSTNCHFHERHCPRERQPAQQGPASSGLEKLWFHSVQRSLRSPSSTGCLPHERAELRVAADSPRTKPAHGALRGWPARPELCTGGADPCRVAHGAGTDPGGKAMPQTKSSDGQVSLWPRAGPPCPQGL